MKSFKKKYHRAVFLGVMVLAGFFALASIAQAAPKAICVPWQPSNISAPHYTTSGKNITLKGIARDGATEYRWDFGDGTSTAWGPISNSYNLGVKHTYTGSVGQLFVATLFVRNAGEEAQDSYRLQIFSDTEDTRINIAIDEGLWYLHTNMIRATYGAGSPGYGQPYGYWNDGYYGYHTATTGVAVDAFQLHGSKVTLDYNTDPYVETVQRAINFLLVNTYSFAIGPQPAGNPDTNGNGIGLVTNHSGSLYDSRQTYIGGICLVALASSGAPNRLAAVGAANVYNRTYAAIVQDMVDFFAFGQCDPATGVHRGGWRYYANYGNSDMSTTQWPPLGMLAAEQNMGSTVPQFVRSELLVYLNYIQYMGLNNDNGAFGYDTPTSYLNITKAAAGIICHEFLGTPLTDQKVQSAIGYIYRHWNDVGGSWDDTKLHGNSYGMYGVMKAMRIPQPDILRVTEYDYMLGTQTSNSFDWYYTPAGQAQQGLATYSVNTQQSDGQWDDTVGSNPAYNAMSTGWRVLVLLKGVTIIPPVAMICDCDKQEYDLNQNISLNASCSYHPNQNRAIVTYEWDFNNDGIFDASGINATITGGFPAAGYYPVTLRVTDNNPENLGGPQTGTTVCMIHVHPPCLDPHASAGGPYGGFVGAPVTLDASASFDPDSVNLTYDWDLDNDGQFDDAAGVNPQFVWHAPYVGVVGVKVCDDGCNLDPTYYTGCDTAYTTVEIGNHAPVADDGGPYTAYPNATITLDGSGSYDPDPEDSIVSHEWDLDNDGDFDDSAAVKPTFTVGPTIGTQYDICLKVTDTFGEYSIDCTSIRVIAEPVCGNGLLEQGEECERDLDCDAGSVCVECACISEGPVCGDGVVEFPEQCEADADCADGEKCKGCFCGSTFADEIIFTAVASSKKIILKWTAVSETNVFGYNILRGRGIGNVSKYEQINTSMISAKGSPETTVAYEFVDDSVKNAQSYWYILEELQTDGQVQQHGPVKATPRIINMFR